MEFEIITKLTQQDYLKINQSMIKNRYPFPSWFYLVARVLGFLCGLISILTQSNDSDLFLGILFVSISLFFFPAIDFFRNREYKKVFQSSLTMQEEVKYSFSKDIVKKSSETSNAELKWNSFNQIIESDDFYLLMTSKVSFLPIRKNVVTEKEINWIKSKIN